MSKRVSDIDVTFAELWLIVRHWIGRYRGIAIYNELMTDLLGY